MSSSPQFVGSWLADGGDVRLTIKAYGAVHLQNNVFLGSRCRWVVSFVVLGGGGGTNVLALKTPRQRPFVLPVMLRLREGKNSVA
jgi:hypothetical protein